MRHEWDSPARITRLMPRVGAACIMGWFIAASDVCGHKVGAVPRNQRSQFALASQAIDGDIGNGDSQYASVSEDGEWIVFESKASNLIACDQNGASDVYLYATATRKRRLVSHDDDGCSGLAASTLRGLRPVSGDGSRVVYERRPNTSEPRVAQQVMLYDANEEVNRLLTTSLSGGPANADSLRPSVSPDGQSVVFESRASDLVAGPPSGISEIFVYDVSTNQVRLVTSGLLGDSFMGVVSDGPAHIAFLSQSGCEDGAAIPQVNVFVYDVALRASRCIELGLGRGAVDSVVYNASISLMAVATDADVLDEDSDGRADVYLVHLQEGKVALVSRSEEGNAADGLSVLPAFAGEDVLVFYSEASDLHGVENSAHGVFAYDVEDDVLKRVDLGLEKRHMIGLTLAKSRRLSVDTNLLILALDSGYPLVGNDRWIYRDVYWKRLEAARAATPTPRTVPREDGEFFRISVLPGEIQHGGWSDFASISGDGHWVAYLADVSDFGSLEDGVYVFLTELATGQVTVVDRVFGGGDNFLGYYSPAISKDGRFIVYFSFYTDRIGGVSPGLVWLDRHTGVRRLVCVDESGAALDASCVDPAVSADGSVVAYTVISRTGLDVFVHNLASGDIQHVSRPETGESVRGDSYAPAISGEGTAVVFVSTASNLIEEDSDAIADVYYYDIGSGRLGLVSGLPLGHAYSPDISGDGSTVVYAATVPGRVTRRVYAFDAATGNTERIADGAEGAPNGSALRPRISGSGRFVAFASLATNLVPGDSNGVADVFLYDRCDHGLSAVTRASRGWANGASGGADLDDSGEIISFVSSAANLVPGDSNGVADVYRRVLPRRSEVECASGELYLPALAVQSDN